MFNVRIVGLTAQCIDTEAVRSRRFPGLLLAATLSLPAYGFTPSRVDMGDFSIDTTEVTIGQFVSYADSRQLKTAAEKNGYGMEYGAGWEKRTGWSFRFPNGKRGAPDEPAVHLSWHEANAYCQAAGGSLPTRAQWSRAAYTEQRSNPPPPFMTGRTYVYPTGDAPTGANTVGAEDGWARHAPAGRTAMGVNGLYDMGANVWEWLADASGEDRLTAGGSWWYDSAKMKADGMQFKPAALYVVYVGFRCAYPR
jgi:formylglycine-generating enzyme required for sulfatase activity